jgi:thiol-disulfide isomerase/thioredoxin
MIHKNQAYMNRIPLFVLLLLLLAGGCDTGKNDLLSRAREEMSSHQTMHYKVTEHAMYSWSPDTIITPYEVWAVRDENDTLRRGYVWVNNYYRPYNIIYNQGDLYLVIPPKKATVLYTPFTEPLIVDIDWIDFFLSPEKLTDVKTDTALSVTTTDSLWQGTPVIALKILKKVNNSIQKQLYLLDKQALVPLFARLEQRSPERWFVDELFFSDYTFDQTDVSQLKEKQSALLTANPVEDRGSGSETSRLEKMLHTGDQAPLITGKYYTTGDPFVLQDFIGRYVIIVDFWYTHCPPCVEAVPALSAFYKEYQDKGLKIFGLNSVDNQPRSMDNLRRFLKKREVSYEIILTRPEVDMQYRINGYPTMYVIDKEGKIAWVEIGFEQEKFTKMKEKVLKLLEE